MELTNQKCHPKLFQNGIDGCPTGRPHNATADRNKTSTLIAGSSDDIRQCTYRKVRSGVCSVIFHTVEPFLFNLLPPESMDEILKKRLANYFDTRDASEKIC